MRHSADAHTDRDADDPRHSQRDAPADPDADGHLPDAVAVADAVAVQATDTNPYVDQDGQPHTNSRNTNPIPVADRVGIHDGFSVGAHADRHCVVDSNALARHGDGHRDAVWERNHICVAVWVAVANCWHNVRDRH